MFSSKVSSRSNHSQYARMHTSLIIEDKENAHKNYGSVPKLN